MGEHLLQFKTRSGSVVRGSPPPKFPQIYLFCGAQRVLVSSVALLALDAFGLPNSKMVHFHIFAELASQTNTWGWSFFLGHAISRVGFKRKPRRKQALFFWGGISLELDNVPGSFPVPSQNSAGHGVEFMLVWEVARILEPKSKRPMPAMPSPEIRRGRVDGLVGDGG